MGSTVSHKTQLPKTVYSFAKIHISRESTFAFEFTSPANLVIYPSSLQLAEPLEHRHTPRQECSRNANRKCNPKICQSYIFAAPRSSESRKGISKDSIPILLEVCQKIYANGGQVKYGFIHRPHGRVDAASDVREAHPPGRDAAVTKEEPCKLARNRPLCDGSRFSGLRDRKKGEGPRKRGDRGREKWTGDVEAARNSRVLACRSFCLAMQASLASGVMSTLITNRLRCDVLEHREPKEKSIAPCWGRDGDGKREKADRGQVARSARKGEAHQYVCRKIHSGFPPASGNEGVRGRRRAKIRRLLLRDGAPPRVGLLATRRSIRHTISTRY